MSLSFQEDDGSLIWNLTVTSSNTPHVKRAAAHTLFAMHTMSIIDFRVNSLMTWLRWVIMLFADCLYENDMHSTQSTRAENYHLIAGDFSSVLHRKQQLTGQKSADSVCPQVEPDRPTLKQPLLLFSIWSHLVPTTTKITGVSHMGAADVLVNSGEKWFLTAVRWHSASTQRVYSDSANSLQ